MHHVRIRGNDTEKSLNYDKVAHEGAVIYDPYAVQPSL